MPQLIWSPAALFDVQRLYRFLAEMNIEAAKRGAKKIRETVKITAQQPGIGRPVDDMEPECREWIIDFGGSGYAALYHYDVQKAVRHQREVGY